MKLYCPDVFIHTTTAEKGPFFGGGKNLDLMPAHLRAAASDVQPVSMCTFLSTFVYFFCDSIVIPHLLLLESDHQARLFPAHAGTVVTHGNC